MEERGAGGVYVTNTESEYLTRRVRAVRRLYWIGVGCGIILAIMGFIFVAFDEGFYDEETWKAFFAFSSFALLSSFGYHKIWGEQRHQIFDPEKPVTSISGTVRIKNPKTFPKYYINDLWVHVPNHWKPFLSDGDAIEAEIYTAPYKSYLLKTSSGLSITKELNRGYSAAFEYREGRELLTFAGLFTTISFLTLILLNSGATVMGTKISPATSWVEHIDQSYEMGFLLSFLMLGPLGLMYYIQHRGAISQIHEMYEEEMGLEQNV